MAVKKTKQKAQSPNKFVIEMAAGEHFRGKWGSLLRDPAGTKRKNVKTLRDTRRYEIVSRRYREAWRPDWRQAQRRKNMKSYREAGPLHGTNQRKSEKMK